jgi:hypothetical protein
MSLKDPYCALEALIEHGQTDQIGDGVICQIVTVLMSDDTDLFEPTACALTAAQARDLAFELLVCAEHAERLTRHYQENER